MVGTNKGIRIGTMVLVYILLFATVLCMLVPYIWMLSSSLKLNKDVFSFPMQWIPANPRWGNFVDIWTRIPLDRFIYNTAKLSIIVTILQLLTSSFAAYAFSNCNSEEKCFIPWIYRYDCDTLAGIYGAAIYLDALHGT